MVGYKAWWNPENPENSNYTMKRLFDLEETDEFSWQGAAYVQDRWSLDEEYDLPIFLNYGLRFDWQEINSGKELSPRFGVTYTPDDRTKVRVNYGWFFQMLALGDVIVDYDIMYERSSMHTWGEGIEFSRYRGARDLQNPINKSFEFGVEREIFPDITLGALYYDKDMQDLLELVDINPDPAIDEYRFINASGAWARGAELKLKKAFSKGFEGRIAYTYQEAKSMGVDRYGNPTGKETWVDWDVRHGFTVSFNAELPYDFYLNGIYAWTSGQPYTREYLVRDEETDQLEREEDLINEEREPYTSSFDITVSKEFQVRDYKLTMMVQSFNLFDHKNVSYMDRLKGEPDHYAEGRRLLFGIELEF